ncbi:MAG: alpha-L-fucosidase [Oscillospiraceae bacterium]|nr:alpha-L-fucosidase [Oscillospiraceae bacterium]
MTKKEYLNQIDSVINGGQYKDNWDSMKSVPVPEWYKNAKFGIFIHWGLYSVPAFNNEWYSRNMYIKDSPEFKHHIETYGEHKSFGYKDFIPLFKAEEFNADEWLDLFVQAGAKYVMPVAEHHDGFQMYKSEISRFNAAEMGPERDVLGELKLAAEKRGVRLCASSHRIEHWWFFGNGREFESDICGDFKEGDFYWASVPENNLDHYDIYTPEPSKEFMEDWLVRTAELIDNYQPAVLYFDWWVQIKAMKPYLKKIAAYYYNRGLEWGKPVAINYKHDAFAFGSAVLDVERGQFASMKPYFWQTCASAATNSWCYTQKNYYKKSSAIIRDLVDIVSKNGSLLLNIGPKASGEIPEEEVAILREIGAWLAVNGEAIYDTNCFRTFGEGPTQIKEGHFTDGEEKQFTSEDIRFTQNGASLYAVVLIYPESGVVKIKTLAERSHDFFSIIKDVEVLGFDEKPVFTRDNDALTIETKTVSSANPVVFKITID